MIIDFDKIEQQATERFKGGNGLLLSRNYVDDKCKIMMSRLAKGANIGYHKHEENSEIICIISGQGHVDYDQSREEVSAGTVHYCPKGHSHALYNDGEDELVYFAVVPEHH